MIRALKVASEDLDSSLVKLQQEGKGISQIIPTPEAINFEQADQEKFGGGVIMNFMIIYGSNSEEE
jgi:hypothetical protein